MRLQLGNGEVRNGEMSMSAALGFGCHMMASCAAVVYEHAIDGEGSELAALVPDTFAGVTVEKG